MKRLLFLLLLLLSLASPAAAQWLELDSVSGGQTIVFWLQNLSDGTDATGVDVTTLKLTFVKTSTTAVTTSTEVTPTASGGGNDCVEVTGQPALYKCEVTAGNVDTEGHLTAALSGTGYRSDPLRFEVVSTAWLDAVRNGNIYDSAGGEAALLASIATRMPATGAGLLTYPRGVAYADIRFVMYNSTTGAKMTTGTVGCRITKDAGAETNCTNVGTIVQVSGTTVGLWRLPSLTSTEMTADSVHVTFTLSDARDVDFEFRVQH